MFQAGRVLEPAFQEQTRSAFWDSIISNYAVDETQYLRALIPLAQSDAAQYRAVTDTATTLIQQVRKQGGSIHMVDALLQEYSLDTREGILLMCLAEALMRIPDQYTAAALIQDKLSDADWQKHVGRSESTLVNASTWGLLLTGRVVKMDQRLDGSPSTVWKRLIKRSGEPVIRSLKRVSRPGRRIYAGVKDLPQVYNDLGIAILSTPRGVISDNEAREQHVGGEILCTVF